MKAVVGVDLGGTKTVAALVEPDGTRGPSVQAATPAADGPEAVLDVVAALVREAAGEAAIAGVGVGTAGIVNGAGRVVSATETFAGWVGTDLAAGLRRRLPAVHRVAVINDVDAHLLGEAWRGAARGHSSALMVAVGTGVGGALLLNGRLWRGARGAAGELGHVPTLGAEGMRCPCGRLGHLEALAAGPGIARAYRAASGNDSDSDSRGVFALAGSGDPTALEVVRAAATGLGRAVAGLVTTFDPGCVVVGGGVAEADGLWWPTVVQSCRNDLVDVFADLPLRRAELGAGAAVLGAARHIFELQGA